MTKKQEFINFIDELMKAAPQIVPSEDVQSYLEAFKGKEMNKPEFTENGRLILKYLQDHPRQIMWKAKDIGEGLFISSRAVSGAMRKLVTDGYVEKVGQDPVIYTITEKGKTVDLTVVIEEENEEL